MGVKRRGPTYPEHIKLKARRRYHDGEAPKDIALGLKAEYPELEQLPTINTIKAWTKGLTRGAAVPSSDWDFAAASPEDVALLAPLFGRFERRGALHPLYVWPSQSVADWFVKLRRLCPDEQLEDVESDARFLASDLADAVGRNWLLAEYLARAGGALRAKAPLPLTAEARRLRAEEPSEMWVGPGAPGEPPKD